MQINVKSIVGPFCVDPDDGNQIRGAVAAALRRGDAVDLDFTEVATITSSFLNRAVGELFGEFSHDVLDGGLSWTGLDQADESLMRLVRDNAIRYFSATDQQREQVGLAQSELVES